VGCLALVLLPVVEAFLLWKVGQGIGVWPTVGMIAVMALIGFRVARAEGTRVLRQVRETLGQGRSPDRDLVSACLVFVGGVLLAWPGPASDVAGLLLLLPPTRALVAGHLRRRWERARAAGTLKVEVAGFGVPGWRPGPGRAPDVIDVEARVIEGPPAALPASGDHEGPDKVRK